MPGFDSWLATRSIRTLEMRVLRQSQSAEYIVRALQSGLMAGSQTSASKVLSDEDAAIVQTVVKEIHHSSLDADADLEGGWLRKQMPRGYVRAGVCPYPSRG